jgi:hypothetical protein
MDSGGSGTNAMQIYEPREVRKEAAVNRHLHVPLSSWILLRNNHLLSRFRRRVHDLKKIKEKK